MTSSSPDSPALGSWFSETAATRISELRTAHRPLSTDDLGERLSALTDENRRIHETECVNLNPATNVMSRRAEAALAAGLGSRPSLGHPGEKYEMGLEAIEELEVMTHDLACRVFGASYAEFRVASGAMSNLYAFMASCQPGDSIIVPPPSIGGHVTHNTAGAAGLYGLQIHEAPIDADRYTVDVAGVAALAAQVKPTLISVGSSLNLDEHPVAALREVADGCGATLLFDAAHACGMIAGGVWANPLDEGAHLMTMSTYKSLGGPAGGLLVTNEPACAARLDAIAYPGLTANFDVGRSTALAYTLLDWIDFGSEYGQAMVDTSAALASALEARDVPLFRIGDRATTTHQFAIEAESWGGGHQAALRLREANLLTCAIGLPSGEGLRLGTPEIARWGMTAADMEPLGDLVARALHGPPSDVAADTTAFRAPFSELHFCS